MRKNKTLATVFSTLFLLAVFFPIIENWKKEPKDSFPLSYYPMFSKKRGTYYKMHYIIGLDGEGGRQIIPYKMAGTGGFNQVRRQIIKAAKSGDEARSKLLEKVSKRIAKKGKGTFNELIEIQLIRGAINIGQFFTGQSLVPEKETILASFKLEGNN